MADKVKLPSGYTHVMAVVAAAVFVLLAAMPISLAAAEPEETTWNSIRQDIFGDAEIHDGSALMTLTTPVRAHDAAIVPFDFRAKNGAQFDQVTIVIDENPAPVAAVIDFGPAAKAHAFSTRFRVNAYSYVRAIARTPDGKLHMVRNYLKASGGCSAPASKDMDQALASLGQTKFRFFPRVDDAEIHPINEGKRLSYGRLMIRHPNSSGLQIDQITHLYIPARYIDAITIRHNGQRVMSIVGGISLSEDPNFQFYINHQPDQGETITVDASDTDGAVFDGQWALHRDVATPKLPLALSSQSSGG